MAFRQGIGDYDDLQTPRVDYLQTPRVQRLDYLPRPDYHHSPSRGRLGPYAPVQQGNAQAPGYPGQDPGRRGCGGGCCFGASAVAALCALVAVVLLGLAAKHRMGIPKPIDQVAAPAPAGEAAAAAPAAAGTADWKAASRIAEVCGFDSSEGGLWGDPFWTNYAAAHQAARGRLVEDAGADDRVLVWQCLDDDFCAGVGDQARGIAATLYTAMLTGRILFVRWSRHGQDVTSMFGQRAVDWRLPDSLLEECGGATWVHDNIEGGLMQRAQSPDRCVAVITNQQPELELAAVEPAGQACSEIPLDMPFEHYVGCAINFLFDFTWSYEALVGALEQSSSPSTAQLVGLPAAPRRYVAVHLRFGDRVFNGDDSPDATMVADALRCARAAGRELFGAEDGDWGIFFASDSVNARALALEQSSGGPHVFASVAPSVHSDYNKDVGIDCIWGVWGDQLLLSRAHGLVQCMDMDRHCDVSGYSQLAAQVALMSPENVWVALSEGCARGGDVTMNSWFDRAAPVDVCGGHVSLLREALSIGQDTPQERKDEINHQIAVVAEHSGAAGWGDLGE